MTATTTKTQMPSETLEEFEERVRNIMARFDQYWWLDDYPRHAVDTLRRYAAVEVLDEKQLEEYTSACKAVNFYAIGLHGATRDAIEELQNEGVDQHFAIEHDADFDDEHFEAHYDGPCEGELAWVQVGDTYLAPVLEWAGEIQLFPSATSWRNQVVGLIVAAEKQRRHQLSIELRSDPNYTPPIRRVNRTRRPRTRAA